MKNQKKTIITGLAVMSVMLSVLVTYNVAFAQEPVGKDTILRGTGGIVDQDNRGHLSHFWLRADENPTNTEDSDSNYEVNNATFVIRKHAEISNVFSWHILSVVPDSWTMTVNSDNTAFEAIGEVQTGEGIVYDVEINGEILRKMQNGDMYSISGTASGDNETYDLYYIASMFDNPN